MPAPTRTLTLQSARDLIRERSFTRGTGDRVGVELEWFTTPSHAPPDVPGLERALAPLGPLPYGSALTFEPGSQVELSTAPFDTVAEACAAADADSALVRSQLDAAGYATFAAGFDPERSLALRTDAPRYVAMRTFFDAYGAAGGRMMCGSAAIHVNVDGGDDDEGRRRWDVAHLLGPTLVAAFANSPLTDTGLSADKSSRMRAWLELDPTRTRPVGRAADPPSAWSAYALGANVMFIRTDGEYAPLDPGTSFASWLDDGHPLGYPTPDDLEYHLTTLFPPIRPHAHLELRMIDMLPEPWWRAAVALTTILVCDRSLHGLIYGACERTADRWDLATKCALEDPPLAESAIVCFDAALDRLAHHGADNATSRVARAYVDRFTRQGRTPADDLIDVHHTASTNARPTIAEAI